MMKVNIAYQNKTVSFEIETNLPEVEAFDVLRCFSVSAFETVPEPLIFVLSGTDSEFQLHGPKDWKEGMQKHFKGVVNLEILSMDSESEDCSEDSWNVITENGDVVEKQQQNDDHPPQNQIPVQVLNQDLKNVAVINDDDQGVIEDYEEEDDNLTDKEEDIEGQQAPQQLPCQIMKQRVMQFIADLGTENMQNIVAVAHMLLAEGAQLGDAIRTALDSSEAVSEHPFVKEFLPHLDMFVAQAGVFTQTLVPFLCQIDIESIIAMIPNIVDSITRALSGEKDVELDVAPIFQMLNPMMMQQMQSLIPNGQSRVFSCDAMNPFKVIEDAQESVRQEFEPERAIHRGITCDGCDMCPIVGVRYKSVTRADFDLCENCEVDHDPNDPLIKIKVPVGDMNLLPGLGEFSSAVGVQHMQRGGRGRCGGRRGRRCGGRRGGRGRRGGFRRMMREAFENGGPQGAMRKMMENGGCPMMRKMMEGCPMRKQQEQEQLAEEFRADPAQAAAAQEAVRIAEEAEKEEQARALAEKQRRLEEIEAKKVELAEQKFQLASIRESMKKSKRELKKMKKGNKKTQKKFKEIQKQTQQVKQLSRATQQKCKEVTHLDLAETAVLKAGGNQLKTWKVKNTGTTIWDENTFAVLVKGNKSIVIPGFEKIHVGAVEPGHVQYIRVMMDVPQQAGDYSITYRLSAPVTGKFGKPLRTTFTVEEEEQEFIDSPPVSAHASVIADREVDEIAEQLVEPSRMIESPVQGGFVQREGLFKEEKKSGMIESPVQNNQVVRRQGLFKDEPQQPRRMMESPVQNPHHMIQRQGLFKQEEAQGAPDMIESPVQNRVMNRSDIQFVEEPAFQFAEQLKSLLEFGFPEDVCKNVLIATSGNVEEAVNTLLS